MREESSDQDQADTSLEAAYEQLMRRFEQQAAELRAAHDSLRREIAEHRRAEEPLRHAHDELERQVERRTAQLASANEELEAKIEQQTRIADALRESEERYRTLIEIAPDSIATLDLKGRITSTNAATCGLNGHPLDEVIGKPFWKLGVFRPSDVWKYLRLFCSLIRGKRSGPVELLCHSKDGTRHTLEARFGFLRQGGRIVGLQVISRNITERKQAQEALALAKEEWERTFDSVPDLIAILDMQHRIVRVNRRMADMLGMTPEECVGLSCYQHIHGVDEPPSYCPHVQLLKDGREHTTEVHEKRLGGDFSVTVSPLFDSAGTLIGGVHVARDITELKAAQERALQAERLAAIGEMVTGLAHESRNALQRSQACLEMLALEVEDRPEALDLVSRIQIAQDHLHHLYEEVRSYAAPIVLHREPVRLADFVDEVWRQLEPSWQGRKVHFDAVHRMPEGSCHIDRAAMRSVFRNIFENCLAACSDPVEILVTSRETEIEGCPAVQIAVCDNGPGLDPEQRTSIFDPFYTTKAQGTGLGMAIAKRIVEAHGGRIAVGPDTRRGAKILITFPKE